MIGPVLHTHSVYPSGGYLVTASVSVDATGARAVLHHHVHIEHLLHVVGGETPDGVAVATGGKRHDQLDSMIGIAVLAECGMKNCRGAQTHQRQHSQSQETENTGHGQIPPPADTDIPQATRHPFPR